MGSDTSAPSRARISAMAPATFLPPNSTMWSFTQTVSSGKLVPISASVLIVTLVVSMGGNVVLEAGQTGRTDNRIQQCGTAVPDATEKSILLQTKGVAIPSASESRGPARDFQFRVHSVVQAVEAALTNKPPRLSERADCQPR